MLFRSYALRGLEIYASMSFLCSLKALVDEFRVLEAKWFAIQLVMSCVKDVTWARNTCMYQDLLTAVCKKLDAARPNKKFAYFPTQLRRASTRSILHGFA